MIRFAVPSALVLFLTMSVHADPGVPDIASISPSSGPVAGGTEVTIRGENFSTTSCPPGWSCDPVYVSFGGVLASNVRVLDAGTLVATTPANLPGNVRVTVERPAYYHGPSIVRFTYAGSPDTAFDRILVPVASLSNGALGTRWASVLSVGSASTPIQFFGVRITCSFPACPYPEVPVMNASATHYWRVNTVATGPAFIYVPREQLNDVSVLLRVVELSRQKTSFGTAIPLPHERQFTSGRIVLNDFPWETGFRLNLRIYGLTPGDASVKVYRTGSTVPWETMVSLSTPLSLFDAPNASLTVFGDEWGTPFHIAVDPVTPGLKIWGFLTATNNESQNVTVISPTTFRGLASQDN